MIIQQAKIRSLPCQRRSLPATCAVKTPSSATWRVLPLRLSAGRWAVQKAGYINGKIALRPASPPGCRNVLGVPGASRPKRLKRSQGPSSADATAYRQASREASVRKGCGSLCVATTSRPCPHCGRSIASSSAIQGGNRTRRAMQSLQWLMALKTPRETVAGRENLHGETVVRDARSPHRRKAPEQSRPGTTAFRMEEKHTRKGA
jgi:hypothetical protein